MKKKKERLALKVLKWVVIFLLLFWNFVAGLITCSAKWALKTWNHLTADELVFHFRAPLEGTNQGMINDFIKKCVVPAVLFAIVVTVILIIIVICEKTEIFWGISGVVLAISVGTSVLSAVNFWNKREFGSNLDKQGQYSELIDEFYVDPSTVNIKFPEKKRNLIYIYMESMETTYTDKKNGGGFQENYIPELTALAQKNEDFSGDDRKLNGGYVVPGTGFTMGAIFGQFCGIPLKTTINANEMSAREKFFPDAVGLGDILEQQGYSQVFILGSEAAFAGKKHFFEQHGNFDIIDYNHAKEQKLIPEGYKVWWGFEDRRSFAFAKEKMLELFQNGQPFNMTILTVDTHFEDGYICELCENQWGNNQYANVISCSSRQISEFVNWIRQQDFYQDTTIVLTGDHITMDSDFCNSVSDDYKRRVYTCFINSVVQPQQKEKREYTLLDYFPTTLAALGVEIDGNRLGLGTNIFSYEQTLVERFGLETVDNELEKKSRFMEKMENQCE